MRYRETGWFSEKKQISLLLVPALFLTGIFLFVLKASATGGTAQAQSVHIASLSTTDGDWTASLTDSDYATAVGFDSGDVLTLTADQPFSALYIEWSRVPSAWTMTANGQDIACGQNGFLHEYVEMGTPVSEVSINMPSGGRMANVYAYTDGTPPADLQIWNPPCDQADFLVFSTHADDEILFLGGVLATYAADRHLAVQVAYMIDFSGTELPVREHEKLDGLWAIGVRDYPVNAAILNDSYSETLDAARASYSYDAVCSFATEAIRRFKPQVVVTQDFNGEYGHGAHMLLAHAVRDAVENANDASYFTDSADAYGTWNVPKAYFHLYENNAIHLDLRQPIASLSGRTAVEAAAEAYKMHVSQQWMDFYVSDDSEDTNKYAPKCADFGLYRTLVGEDTGNDMMEHLTSYAAQKEADEEAKRLMEEQKRQEEEQAQAALTYTDVTGAGTGASVSATEEDQPLQLPVLRIALIAVAVFALISALLSGLALFRKNRRRRRNRKRLQQQAKRNARRRTSTRRRGY